MNKRLLFTSLLAYATFFIVFMALRLLQGEAWGLPLIQAGLIRAALYLIFFIVFTLIMQRKTVVK